MMVLDTADGQVVTIEINNNAAYGYDVRAELVGERASTTMNPIAYTRTDAALAHATAYDADWRTRYAEAYRRQSRAFLRFVQTGVFPEIAASAWDGYAAALVAGAGVRALSTGEKVPVTIPPRPEFYA
jgi:myo-inositol 2-dehydrogenase/D-chiro-inositol 1-dehydrogenase